jgi:hypothetical protein
MRLWEIRIKETNSSSLDLDHFHVLANNINEALKIADKLIEQQWTELLKDLRKDGEDIEIVMAKAEFDIDVPEKSKRGEKHGTERMFS